MGIIAFLYLIFYLLEGSIADYRCVCNYNVELSVYSTMSEQSTHQGYLYELDCRETIPLVNASKGWAAIAFRHKIGYVKLGDTVKQLICPGDADSSDTVTSTSGTTLSGISGATVTSSNGPSSTTPTTPIVQSSTPTTASPVNSSTTATKPPPQLSTATTTTTARQTTVTTASTTSRVTHTAQTTPRTTLPPSKTTKASSTGTTASSNATSQSSTKHITTASPHSSAKSTTATVPQSSTKPTTTTAPQSSTNPTTTAALQSSTDHTTTVATIVLQFSNATVATTSAAAPVCNRRSSASITTTFGQSCYEVVPTHTTWNNAEADCKNREGHLMHILNDEEQQFITMFLFARFDHEVWIGLGDYNHEERFEWTSGVPLLYTHWKPGRQNFLFHGIENCVALQPHDHGYWDDRQCSGVWAANHPYVCQFSGKHAGSVIIG